MARGTIASDTLTSVGSAEIYTDGHSLNSVDLVITGDVSAEVEYSNSGSAAVPLWSTYSSMTGVTSSQSGNSFYCYEKMRVRATALIGSATVPSGAGNTGNGTISAITCTDATVSESWTITCTDDSGSGNETWSVVGSVSGAQPDATTGVPYTSNSGEIEFTITDGAVDFVAGDAWTFTTTQGTAKIYFSGYSSGE